MDKQEQFNRDVKEVLEEVSELLRTKNLKYGDAMLSPVKIFSDQPPEERIKARLDEKLARIIEGSEMTDHEDTVMDLIGVLIILRVAQKRNARDETKAKEPAPETK